MGSIVLFGHRIRDHKPFGVLTVKEIMQYSSDVGAIKLGLRLGQERFANYIDRFGFGKTTNIDLPGEERGLTKPASRWSKISIGAISMGQEIGVTSLQILSMVSAVANGGILYRPYVVKRVQDPLQGVISETEPRGLRVISEGTARQLQDMLEVVVTDGTAKDSKLDGYRAAGKTGTAQKIDEHGRYGSHKYVASFVGYAPASNPSLALIVVIDEPAGAYYGAQIAAPIFKKIAEQVLRYKSVAPDVPSYAPEYKVDEKPKREPLVGPRPATTGPVELVSLNVVPGFNPRSVPDAPELGDIPIPDFYGKSLRQVTEECLKAGLRLQSIGSGAAVQQLPLPGTSVRAGSRVRVRFSSKVERR